MQHVRKDLDDNVVITVPSRFLYSLTFVTHRVACESITKTSETASTSHSKANIIAAKCPRALIKLLTNHKNVIIFSLFTYSVYKT